MIAAYLIGNREVEVRETPDPIPGPDDVILAMKASGLCGSDFRLYRSQPSANSGIPKIAGHEPCGEVSEVGSNVKRLAVGDRVMMHHYTGCGSCTQCRAGFTQMCLHHHEVYGFTQNGGHADFLLAPASTCIPLPETISYLAGAACACGTGTAFHALRRLDLKPKESLAVFGQGPVGLSVTLFAVSLGIEVFAVDVIPERLKLATKLGVQTAINANEVDPVGTLRELTGGDGPDATLDATGIPDVRLNAVDSVRLWGRVCFVGEGNTTTFDISRQIIHRQLTLYGSWTFSKSGLREVAQFVERHNIPLEELITHTYSLNEAARAYEVFDTGKTGKVILTWPQ